MTNNIFFIVGCLVVLNVVFFTLISFLLFEVFRDLHLFKMFSSMIIAACGSFLFIVFIPLTSMTEQLVKNPLTTNVFEALLRNFINVLPLQFSLTAIGMCTWTIIKCDSLEK